MIDTDLWDTEQELYVPVTPGETILTNLAAKTEEEAIANLLKDAAHMPYDGWDSPDGYGFKQRGYEIWKVKPSEAKDS
jgi:hypothetical protein